MLRLVASLQKVRGAHRHYLCQSSYASHVTTSVPVWPQRIRQHFVLSNSSKCALSFRLHGEYHLSKVSSLSARGLAIPSTTSSPGASQSGFAAWYLRMLEKYPLPTKSVTAANILAFADMTAQYLENVNAKEGEPKEDWDKARTLRMLGIGAFFSAPILHMWFNLMQRTIPTTDVASAIKKVLLGQIVASPIVNSAFFAVNSFLQGETGEQAIEKIKRDLWPTWKSGAMYWPLLDFVTFRYVPLHLQVFFNNCCSFIWTIYLTSMAGKKAPSTEKLVST